MKIRACLSLRPRAILEADTNGEHFRWFNWHFSGYDRKLADAGRASYIPGNRQSASWWVPCPGSHQGKLTVSPQP